MPKQLLIADDSYLVRETIKNVLAGRTDIAVCGEASNGLETVEKAKALKPDLILLDLAMPEMNGAETASVLKMTVPDVRIILFTMHSENVGSYLTSAIGIDAVLSKPDGMTRYSTRLRPRSLQRPRSSMSKNRLKSMLRQLCRQLNVGKRVGCEKRLVMLTTLSVSLRR